jgi:excisionase family DNA binding protein
MEGELVALRKTEMPERIYTLDEAAKWLGFHRNTIRKWIESGELVATRPGKEFRIRQSDLDEFLRRKQIKPRKNT